jgi:CTP:phosphocholine cytidylyltransferase-like protein
MKFQKTKWEVVCMEYISALPITISRHNSIMVFVDKLTKVAHFVPTKIIDYAPYMETKK